MVVPLSLPGILTVVIFTSQKPITLGVATDLIGGDIFYWGELMAGALIASIPVAIAYNLFLDRFISGITRRGSQVRLSRCRLERSGSLLVHAEQPVGANPLAAFIKFAPATTYCADIRTDQPANPIKQ
jgi:hypothetical protein